jgi:hypothetical protein
MNYFSYAFYNLSSFLFKGFSELVYLSVCYLTTLLGSRLYRADDMMMKDYAMVVEMRIRK